MAVERRGYFDFQEYAGSPSGTILTDTTGIGANGSKILGPLYVGGAPGVGLRVHNVSGGRIKIKLGFFSNFTQSQLTDDYSCLITPFQEIHHIIPAYGPWMTVQTTELAGIATPHETRAYIPQSGGRVDKEQSSWNILHSEFSNTVAANSTESFDLNQIRPGPAFFQAYSPLTDFNIRLQAFQEDGTFIELIYVNEQVVSFQGILYLPPLPIRVRYSNETAASGVMRGILVAQPAGQF